MKRRISAGSARPRVIGRTSFVRKSAKEYLVLMNPAQLKWIESPEGQKLWRKLKLRNPRLTAKPTKES